MMKKNGFIATSLIYSFFLIFCALLLCYVGIYMHNKLLIDNISDEIKTDLSSKKTVFGIPIGSYVYLNMDTNYFPTINSTIHWIKISDSNTNPALFISDDIVYSATDLDSATDPDGLLSNVNSEFINGKHIVKKDDLKNVCNSGLSFYVINKIIGNSVQNIDETNRDEETNLEDIPTTPLNYLLYDSSGYKNFTAITVSTDDTIDNICAPFKNTSSTQIVSPTNLDHYNVRVVLEVDNYYINSGSGMLNDPFTLGDKYE